ncbi:hypothetical protein GCM10010232_16500 [Streptomyces amakusaensis]
MEQLWEREHALDESARCAALARAGEGRWLLLHGDTGAGRTALLKEVVRRESADGRMRALRAHAAPGEEEFAYALLRRLLPGAGQLPFGGLSPSAEQRLLHRLTEHLAVMAAQRPVLLAVDDIHHADAASLRWVAYLSHRLVRLPVLLVLTACTGPGRSGALFPPGAGQELHMDTGGRVPLHPLGPESAGRILTSKALRGDPARRAAAMGAGNPGLLNALAAGSAAGEPEDLAAGAGYRTALAHWLGSPAAPARRPVALTLALMPGADLPPLGDTSLIASAVVPLPDRSTVDSHLAELMPLLAAPEVREAVLATATDQELPHYRRRLAHALYDHGRPASCIARLLLHTPQTGEAWITHTLEEAAEHALRADDPEHAAGILRHALTGPVEPTRHCALTLRLSALDMLHSSRTGIRRLRASLQRADCHDPYAVSESLSGALVAQGHVHHALQILKETGRAADDDQLNATLRIAVAGLSNHDAREWHHTVHDLRELQRTVEPSVEPLVCALLTIYEGGTGRIDVRTATERITTRLHRPVNRRLRTGFIAAAAAILEWADRLVEARNLVDRELPAVSLPPDLTNQAHQQLIATRTQVDRKLGRFRQLIEQTTPLLEAVQDDDVQLPYLRALTACAWYELGSPERAWRLLDALGPLPDNTSWTWDEVLYTQGRLHLGAGDWHQALAVLTTLGARMDRRGFVNPVGQPWRTGAATALVRLGRHTEARTLAEENLHHARAWGTARDIGTALRTLALTLRGRPALNTLAEAVGMLRTAPAPAELIVTLTDLGRTQTDTGSTCQGHATLLEALHLAQTLLPPQPPDGLVEPPTPRLLAGVEHALRRHDAHRRPAAPAAPSTGLTPAERRITELAVQGLTNDEIGSQLHLARRTVETHLTKAYRKLGITRRTQLAAKVGEVAGRR